MAIKIDATLHKSLKIKCAKLELPMSEAIDEAIEDWLSRKVEK